MGKKIWVLCVMLLTASGVVGQVVPPSIPPPPPPPGLPIIGEELFFLCIGFLYAVKEVKKAK